jgi:hypothetical protein
LFAQSAVVRNWLGSDGKGVAVLDLHTAKKPTVKIISGLSESGSTEPLGEQAFMMINEPYNYTRAVPRDYQVIDISSPSDPLLLTTVKEVRHQVANGDTGTTFLLGRDGLTVVRRLSVENDYKVHLMQLSNNWDTGESGYFPSPIKPPT